MPRRLFSGHVCKGSFPAARPAPDKLFHDSILFCPRCNGVRRRGPSLSVVHVLCGTGGGLRRGARARRRGPVPGDLVRGGGARAGASGVEASRACGLGHHQCGAGHPPDRHFSAWSRPKPAPDPLPGPSVASGVIPTKGGRNEVLQPPPGRAPQGRWRSSPWKRCNHAAPRGRVREHPAPLGALRRSPTTMAR